MQADEVRARIASGYRIAGGSLMTPITNTDMAQGGSVGYVPVPVSPPVVPGVGSRPMVSASASAGNNSIAFAAGGFVVFAVITLYALHEWGFRVAHVPV